MNRFASYLVHAIVGGLLFGMLYVPVSALTFAKDDADRLLPPSPANLALWSVLGLTTLGLMLGSADRGKAGGAPSS
jgi:hypothetical protein